MNQKFPYILRISEKAETCTLSGQCGKGFKNRRSKAYVIPLRSEFTDTKLTRFFLNPDPKTPF